uniref:T-cell immunoreceptor with Ig and ITIM domains n=1 Tax=Homo sapiens TaxID=9606 RepID=UPI002FE4FA7F
MMTGTIETTGNISAEKGGSIILQCHLSSTTAQVTQVNWEQQDQLLAICNADLGWHISPSFKDRVAPGPGLGLTLQSLTVNDTGEYFCIYHTYPDGTYTGRIFLEVLELEHHHHHH